MSISARAVHGVHALKVCVIPHPDNDYRPWALRHRALMAVSTLLVVAKIAAVSVIALTPVSAELSTITSAKIVELTNAERKKAGLSSLTVNSLLTNAAQQKAQHMLDEDYFAHISPSGVTPWFWMAKVGYAYQIAGENLAIDFIEAENVVAAWLASPSHKDNMLHTAYAETGVAVATGEFQGGTSTVVVHMFGRPVGAAQPSPPGATAGEAVAAPAPSPTPVPATPTPLPPTPEPDTTPPRVPRIALVGAVETVKNTIEIEIEGEPSSSVKLLVNNQERETLRLPESGLSAHSLDVSGLPEGPIVLRAYGVDDAENQSDVSEALAVTKDTVGPLLAENDLSFMLSPRTDAAVLAVRAPGGEVTIGDTQEGWLVVGSADEPIDIALSDPNGNVTELAGLDLAPKFFQEAAGSELTAPSQARQFSRRMAGVIAVILIVLLLLAMLIRVRVQHPSLIAHTTAVILLAIALWIA